VGYQWAAEQLRPDNLDAGLLMWFLRRRVQVDRLPAGRSGGRGCWVADELADGGGEFVGAGERGEVIQLGQDRDVLAEPGAGSGRRRAGMPVPRPGPPRPARRPKRPPLVGRPRAWPARRGSGWRPGRWPGTTRRIPGSATRSTAGTRSARSPTPTSGSADSSSSAARPSPGSARCTPCSGARPTAIPSPPSCAPACSSFGCSSRPGTADLPRHLPATLVDCQAGRRTLQRPAQPRAVPPAHRRTPMDDTAIWVLGDRAARPRPSRLTHRHKAEVEHLVEGAGERVPGWIAEDQSTPPMVGGSCKQALIVWVAHTTRWRTSRSAGSTAPGSWARSWMRQSMRPWTPACPASERASCS
jgi:hypothetical protein